MLLKKKVILILYVFILNRKRFVRLFGQNKHCEGISFTGDCDLFISSFIEQ